ncbi:MBOAT family O-acyltransferase, partial [Mucilaginibacter sp.]|uniref:MBOAT family O-acyltransferase n=1 Tax=Mucilaginibacter sp. TaxID=1882438 RepID=UPI002610CA4A
RNTFIIFLVSGFWHGANWTFIVWGGLNAIFIMPSIIFNTNRNNFETVAKGKKFATVGEFFNILLTFTLVLFAWIFFRANNLTHALSYIGKIFSKSLFTMPALDVSKYQLLQIAILIIAFMTVEWFGRENRYAIEKLKGLKSRNFRLAFYFSMILIAFLFMGRAQAFIYFQF